MLASSSPLISPYHTSYWLDESDYFIDGRNRRRPTHEGLLALKDLTVDRNRTEFSAMVSGIYAACNRTKLTHRQVEAVELAREAMQHGKTPTSYISQQLGINRHSAWKILNRADARLGNSNLAKMETFAPKPDIISRDSYLKIADADIEKAIASIEVLCAGHGTPHCAEYVTAKYRLCYHCRKKYGMTVEDRRANGHEWVNEIMNRSYTEARKQARKKLYDERYGVVNIEDIDT